MIKNTKIRHSIIPDVLLVLLVVLTIRKIVKGYWIPPNNIG